MFFLYGAGVGAVTPYLTTFIKQVTGCGNSVSLALSAFLLVMTAVGSLVFGPQGDKIGFKRLLMLSMALVGIAALNALWVSSLLSVAAVLAVAGLGIGAQNASAYPLLTRLVPVKEIGFYVGLQTAAASLAGPGAVLVTGFLINHHNGHGQSGYRLIFAVCAACLLLALVAVSFLREPRAEAEVAARERVI
jgi:maltose/moltooligosaccharide transporter